MCQTLCVCLTTRVFFLSLHLPASSTEAVIHPSTPWKAINRDLTSTWIWAEEAECVPMTVWVYKAAIVIGGLYKSILPGKSKWLNLTVCQVWQLDVPRQSDGLICQRTPITAVHEVAIFMQPWHLASHVWTTRTNIHHMYSAKNSFFFLFFFFHYQFKVAPAICVTVSKYLEHEKNSAAQLLHQPTIRLLCYL